MIWIRDLVPSWDEFRDKSPFIAMFSMEMNEWDHFLLRGSIFLCLFLPLDGCGISIGTACRSCLECRTRSPWFWQSSSIFLFFFLQRFLWGFSLPKISTVYTYCFHIFLSHMRSWCFSEYNYNPPKENRIWTYLGFQ